MSNKQYVRVIKNGSYCHMPYYTGEIFEVVGEEDLHTKTVEVLKNGAKIVLYGPGWIKPECEFVLENTTINNEINHSYSIF